MITEVLPKNRINQHYGESEWSLPGYSTCMPDFNDYAGRGCIIYTRNTLEAYQVNLGNMEFIEYNAIGVKCSNNQKLLIVCVYRSPSVTDPECIKKLSTILTTKKVDNINYNYTLILGDFNFREIDWTSQTTSTSENHITTRFLYARLQTGRIMVW